MENQNYKRLVLQFRIMKSKNKVKRIWSIIDKLKGNHNRTKFRTHPIHLTILINTAVWMINFPKT